MSDDLSKVTVPKVAANVIRIALLEDRAEIEVADVNAETIKVSALAVRRPFGDAARRDERRFPDAEAWLVGENAKALIDAMSRGALLAGQSMLDEVVRDGTIQTALRHRVGLVAAVRDEIGYLLETRINLQSVFVLPGEKSDTESPPFWLIYALRRFNWPGEVFVTYAKDPLARVKRLIGASYLGPRALIRPALGGLKGALEGHDEDEALLLSLSLHNAPPTIFAPKGCMLPTEHHAAFFDQKDSSDGDIKILLRTPVDTPWHHVVRVTRSEPTHGEARVGSISMEVAPVSSELPYTVVMRVDAWGRLTIGLRDPQARALPIAIEGQTGAETMVLPVLSLLFPGDDEHLLLGPRAQPPSPDFIEILDQTTFNGRPIATVGPAEIDVQKRYSVPHFWQRISQRFGAGDWQPSLRDLYRMELCSDVLEAQIDIDELHSQPFTGKVAQSLDVGLQSNKNHTVSSLERSGQLVIFERDRREGKLAELADRPSIKRDDKSPLERFYRVLARWEAPLLLRLRDELEREARKCAKEARGEDARSTSVEHET